MAADSRALVLRPSADVWHESLDEILEAEVVFGFSLKVILYSFLLGVLTTLWVQQLVNGWPYRL